MTLTVKNTEEKRMAEARESFSGRLLTDAQFEEAMAITRIIEREIAKSGSFKDKLGDYAYAMARTEKMDAVKAETTIRDLFKARTGQTMNQMREKLAQREEKLPKDAVEKAHMHIARIGERVQHGDKMTFYRAYAFEAQDLGMDLEITDAAAKNLMRETFKQAEKREIFEWGKELDETYFRPQIEAEAKTRSQSADDKEHPEQSAAQNDAPSRLTGRGDSDRQPSPAASSFRRSAPRLSR